MAENKNNVQAVLAYLSSLWGAASGFSVLFPLSNALLQAVPNNIFVQAVPQSALTPTLLTTFATIVSLFSILLVISWRRDIAKAKSFNMAMSYLRNGAIVMMAVAVITLLFYISIADTYQRNYSRTSDTLRSQAELMGFFGYPLIFASFTTAFTLLGLREYLIERKETADESQTGPAR